MSVMSRRLPDTLHSGRLILREPRQSDAALLFDAYTQDPEVARYMVWKPHAALAETEYFIAGCIRGWNAGERQPYILAMRESQRQPIGMLEARLQPHTVDIGYVLARRHWDQGFMSEAIQTLTEAALAVPDIFRVQATCDIANRASVRALQKAGFVQEGQLERYLVHPNISAEPRACFMYARCR